MTGRYTPHLVLTMLIGIWSGSFVVAKIALLTLSPFALVGLRFAIASVCMLPFVRGGLGTSMRRTLGPGVVSGLVLGSAYFLQMYGVRETTASTGGFLTGLIVLIVAVGGALFFGARFGVRSLLGLLLGLSGIVLLCLPDPAAGGTDTLRGILLQIGSSIGFAVHILLLSHYGRSLPIAAFTLWQLVVIAIAGSLAAAMTGGLSIDAVTEVHFDTRMLLLLGYLGVLATAFAIGVQAKVQHRIPPTHVALLFCLQPLGAALCGWAFQGDRLGAVQLTGGAIIVAGVALTSLDRPRAR
jgi:drug/metabolite transporter (DMT)-like permease